MGHRICKLSVPENCDRKVVLDKICDHAKLEGDGYSGPIHWHDEINPLPNRKAAEEWIQEHDNGRYDDHAVRYYDHTQASITPKIKDLQAKNAELTLKLSQYTTANSVKCRKSEFIGCPCCGSKLARNRLHTEFCPLCKTDLRSKTTLNTIAEYHAKMKTNCEKIAKEQEKQKAARRVLWLVKYEFHQ